MTTPLVNILEKNKQQYYPVVPFEPGIDRLLKMDFTEANQDLTKEVIEDVSKFSSYVDEQLSNAGTRYGIGGYAEHRSVYSRSNVFDAPDGGLFIHEMGHVLGLAHTFGNFSLTIRGFVM